MEPKPINIKLTVVLALLLAGAGATGGAWLSGKDFAEMAAEVDRVRAAQAKVLDEAGQYRETVPIELAKAIKASHVSDPRVLSGPACDIKDGRVFVQLAGGVELQLPPSLTTRLQPEVDAIKAEWEAAVAAKAEALAAEEAAKAAAQPAERLVEAKAVIK